MADEMSYADLMRRSLEEAGEIKKGRRDASRISRRALTRRDVVTRPPREITSERARAIRARLRLSQSVFAGVLNVSTETVRAWEQGKRTPRGPALKLLEIAERDPAALVGSDD